MKRVAAALAMGIVLLACLSGCGGGNAYCDAIEKNKTMLDTFGKNRTNADYEKYAKAMADVAKVAPKSIAKDWSKLSDVTTAVITAQADVGVALEDMTDKDKLGTLSSAELKKLNAAYEVFNKTSAERNAVVKNAKQECKITLK